MILRIALVTLTTSFALLARAATPATVTFAMTSEPPQLNSMKTSDLDSIFVLGHIMEGLTRFAKSSDGSVVPGVATDWKITDQEAVFHLRKNAHWSDGSLVTAQDFVFAWKTALLPATASQYAFILFPIKNAEAITAGNQPPEALGVTLPDPYTIKIQLERPCAYFASLTAFPTYFPVKEAFYAKHAARYAANIEDLIFNGPYRLQSWTHGASLSMELNPSYWNPSLNSIAKIDVPYITPDNSTKFNLFKNKKIDLLIVLSKDDLPKAEREGYKVQRSLDGSVRFLEFNLRNGRPTANRNLRLAIQRAFDTREELLSKVIGIPGTRAAYSLIPYSIRGIKRPFIEEYPLHYPKFDLKEANRLLAEAKKQLGGTIPPLTLLVKDTPEGDREGQYFQQLFKLKLGLEIKIDRQILKQRLAKMNAGDFDIVATNWSPDYPDPMTFAELKASWSKANRGRWENTAYDNLIREAQATSNRPKRFKALAKANQILTDEAAVIPTYEWMVLWTASPQLDGVVRRAFGPDPDFTYAHYR